PGVIPDGPVGPALGGQGAEAPIKPFQSKLRQTIRGPARRSPRYSNGPASSLRSLVARASKTVQSHRTGLADGRNYGIVAIYWGGHPAQAPSHRLIRRGLTKRDGPTVQPEQPLTQIRSMITKRPAPDLIRGGHRFSEKIMLHQ